MAKRLERMSDHNMCLVHFLFPLVTYEKDILLRSTKKWVKSKTNKKCLKSHVWYDFRTKQKTYHEMDGRGVPLMFCFA